MGTAAAALRIAATALLAMDVEQLQVGHDLFHMASKYKSQMNLLKKVHFAAQLGSMHIWRMRLREVQLRAAIEDGSQWQSALEAARMLLPFYRLVYPQVDAAPRAAQAIAMSRPACTAEGAHLLCDFLCPCRDQVWPNLGLHLAAVAKIAALLDHTEEAAGAAQGAAGILRYTHPASDILQDMLRLHHEASMELRA